MVMVKLLHPAQVLGREFGCVRICVAQVLNHGNGGVLLWPSTNLPTNGTLQIHLCMFF